MYAHCLSEFNEFFVSGWESAIDLSVRWWWWWWWQQQRQHESLNTKGNTYKSTYFNLLPLSISLWILDSTFVFLSWEQNTWHCFGFVLSCLVLSSVVYIYRGKLHWNHVIAINWKDKLLDSLSNEHLTMKANERMNEKIPPPVHRVDELSFFFIIEAHGFWSDSNIVENNKLQANCIKIACRQWKSWMHFWR